MQAQSVLVGAAQALLRRVLLGVLYAAASGVLLALALPPYDVPLLGFIAFAPLLVAAFHAPRYASTLYALIAATGSGMLLRAWPFSARSPFDWTALTPFAVFGAFLSDKGTRLYLNYRRRSRVFLRFFNLAPQPPLRKHRGGAVQAQGGISPLSVYGGGMGVRLEKSGARAARLYSGDVPLPEGLGVRANNTK